MGYARVSKAEQNTRLQTQALRKAGLKELVIEHASGGHPRPKLKKLLASLQKGDTLIVWRLDRLARSVKELTTMSEELHERGIELRSLSDEIDTRTASGRLMFHVLAAVAEFERGLLRERITAGVAAARARGVPIGRRPVMGPMETAMARTLLDEGHTRDAVARRFGVARSSLSRALIRDPPPSKASGGDG